MLHVPISGSVLISAVLAPISKFFWGWVLFMEMDALNLESILKEKFWVVHIAYICNLLCASELQVEDQLFGISVSIPAGFCTPYRDLHAQGTGIKLCSLIGMTLAKISVLSIYKHPQFLRKRSIAQSTVEICCSLLCSPPSVTSLPCCRAWDDLPTPLKADNLLR